MKSSNILICLSNKQNTLLMKEFLGKTYKTDIKENIDCIDSGYDLIIVDLAVFLKELKKIQSIKENEEPVLLPVLVTVLNEEIKEIKKYFDWIDEIIIAPVEKYVLLARINHLINTRNLSLKLKQKNEDQKTFMHALVHDIRNPLNFVLSFSYLIKKTMKPEPGCTIDNYFKRLDAGIKKIMELIESLLSFFKLEYKDIELSWINLKEVICDIQTELADDFENYSGSIDTDFRAGKILTDPSLFKIIITNLVLNSLKYGKPETRPLIKISSYLKSNSILLKIEDNGVGIKSEYKDEIFFPFTRFYQKDDKKGIGLGLYTVQRIVTMLKGSIDVESVYGQGTTFILTFPSHHDII